jgi:hypothetical protein
MDTTKRPTLVSRTGLGILAVAVVAAVIWAASALAASGSSPAVGPVTAGNGVPWSPSGLAATTPEQGAAPSRDDCPGHSGGDSGGDSPGSDGSSSTDAV